MSEDGGQAVIGEEAGRYSGGVGVGESAVRAVVDAVELQSAMTDAEREHNAQMFGVTYRERIGRRAHNRCIILCMAPNPRRLNQCPSCYGKAVPMDIYAAQLEPMPGRAARMGRWAGEWAAAFWEAVTLPFHRSQEHARALVVDVLRDAMAAGLTAEVDGLDGILATLEGIEGELRAIRNAAERSE